MAPSRGGIPSTVPTIPTLFSSSLYDAILSSLKLTSLTANKELSVFLTSCCILCFPSASSESFIICLLHLFTYQPQLSIMSSVFGVTAADFESRIPAFIPQGRSLPLYIASAIVFMFIFLNLNIYFPDFPVWLVLWVLVMAGIILKYASFELHPRTQVQARTIPQQVHVPTFVRREQLDDIRIQLAALNREFNDTDYDALRALDEDITSNAPVMSEEEINALPIYRYKDQTYLHSELQDGASGEISAFEELELICSICMEKVDEGETIRRLPCSHQGWWQ